MNLSIDSELKTGSRWGLNDWTDYTQQLIYISIKSDVIVNSFGTWKHEKFNCNDEFLGSNWREGLENVEDGWDWVIKLKLIPEAQDDFYKLGNSQTSS